MFAAKLPFDVTRVPFYYGWAILLLAVLAMFSSLPGQTAGIAAFTQPLCAVTGLSDLQLSIAYLLGTATSGLVLPSAGRLVDRLGARRAYCMTTACLALTLFTLVKVLQQLKPAAEFATPVFMVTMACGFLGVRFFGQGLLPIIANTLVGKWFDRRRARAAALLGVVNGLAFSYAPKAMSDLVDLYDWDGGWLRLALVLGLGVTAIAWLFCRDTPEACGLSVDGEQGSTTTAQTAVVDRPATEAVRSLEFLVIALMLCAHGTVLTGYTFHLQSIGPESGISTKAAMAFFVPVAIISIPTGFTMAWLSDRLGARAMLTFMGINATIAYLSLAVMDRPGMHTLAAVTLGLTTGTMGPIMSTAVPACFGRSELGAINGKLHSLLVMTSAVGPLIFAGVRAVAGELRISTAVLAIIPACALAAATRIPWQAGRRR